MFLTSSLTLRHFSISFRHVLTFWRPLNVLRPIYAFCLDPFALPMTSDTLALLVIISMLAILVDILQSPRCFATFSRFLAVSCASFISAPHVDHRDPRHSTSMFEPNRPHTSQSSIRTRHTSHITPNTRYIAMPARFDRLALSFQPQSTSRTSQILCRPRRVLTQANIEDEQEKKHYACRLCRDRYRRAMDIAFGVLRSS